MEALADLIARHTLLVLFGAAGIALFGIAIFWRLVVACVPVCRRLAEDACNWLSHTGLAERAKHWPRLYPWLNGPLTVARFLGLFAIAAFGFAICALAIFFELADEIGADESLGRFDVMLSAALREHVSHDVLRFFAMITWLGEPELLAVLAGFVAVLLLAQHKRMVAGAWTAATIGGALMNRLLKAVFERSRPVHDHGLVNETSWSFPSGHASGSVLIYGLLGYLIMRHTPRVWHLPVALVGIALIVFVGASRVVLQVHYLSDVLAGYVSAAAWVAIWIAGLEAARIWRPPS